VMEAQVFLNVPPSCQASSATVSVADADCKVGSPKDLVKLNRLGPNGEAPETFARVASSSAGRFVNGR
jgi:hypothetical protein